MAKADKETLKALRKQRETFIEKAKKNVKQNNALIRKIRDRITQEVGTVPEIAKHTNLSADQVLYFIATLKKYGVVSEGPKDGDYYTYQSAEQA